MITYRCVRKNAFPSKEKGADKKALFSFYIFRSYIIYFVLKIFQFLFMKHIKRVFDSLITMCDKCICHKYRISHEIYRF